MAWSWNDARRVVDVVDGVNRIMVQLWRLLLLLIIAAVFVVVGLVVVYRPWGDGNQGEWFYFGGAVLLVLGWAGSQLWVANARLSRGSTFEQLESVLETTKKLGGGGKWSFRLGGGEPSEEEVDNMGNVRFSFSKKVEFPFGSMPVDILPDEGTLRHLEREIERGVTLEDACRQVQPTYDEWNATQQKAYSLIVAGLLDERRSAR